MAESKNDSFCNKVLCSTFFQESGRSLRQSLKVLVIFRRHIMRRLNSQFTTKYISEAGTRAENKDYFGFVEMDNVACWVIAEGYDKDTTISSAKLAVDTVISEFTKKPSLSKRTIKRCIKEANRQLKLQSSKFHLKASILVVVSNYTKLRYAVCGNCRFHIFRGSNILEKSHDTSLYQEMIQQQEIVDDGEKGIEESRNLLQYLGKQGHLKIKVSKKKKLQNEDILLMTTWGLWEKITTVEMLDTLEDAKDAESYIDDLQDLFLSKQTNTVNNHTIATVFIGKTFQEKNYTQKIIKIAIMILIPVLIIAAITGFVNWKAEKKRKEIIATVEKIEKRGDGYITEEDFDRALREYESAAEQSEELKKKTGKKGKQNTAIKERLEVKQKTTEYLTDGEEAYSSQDYENAQKSYNKALKEAKNNMDFYDLLDKDSIKQKQDFCQDAKYISSLIDLADAQAELADYIAAAQNYAEAKQIAAENGDNTAINDINLKIKEMQSKMTEEMKQQIEQQQAEEEKAKQQQQEQEEALKQQIETDGAAIELEADALLAEGNTETAKQYYQQAMQMYKDAGVIEKASLVQKKIIDADATAKQQQNDIKTAEGDAYVLNGDNFLLENKFAEAIEEYKKAKDIYSQVKNTDKVAEIIEKISAAQVKQKENDIAEQKMNIGVIEARGDEALKLQQYDKAKEFYLQSQALYQGINDMDKVAEVQEKIKVVQQLQEEIRKAREEQGIPQ